ncbi:MAG TPA: hypothetical protein VGA16_00750, partial [Candidatus Limnocylindria bacterium]
VLEHEDVRARQERPELAADLVRHGGVRSPGCPPPGIRSLGGSAYDVRRTGRIGASFSLA